jgi:hypothetical protein
MKLIKLFAITACAFALVAGSTLAQDKPAKKKQSCCEKAKAAGKECTHPCCVEAKKDGKVCEKCNPKKGSKKSDKKDESK